MCTLFEEIAKEGEARGEALGEARGKTKVNTLITKLSELGRIDDIIRSAADSVYQQELFREFGL